MLLPLLGMLDILVAFALLFPSGFSFYIAILIFLKGISSILGALLARKYFDWMGTIDLLASFFLFLKLEVPFFWLLPLLKGIYTFCLSPR